MQDSFAKNKLIEMHTLPKLTFSPIPKQKNILEVNSPRSERIVEIQANPKEYSKKFMRQNGSIQEISRNSIVGIPAVPIPSHEHFSNQPMYNQKKVVFIKSMDDYKDDSNIAQAVVSQKQSKWPFFKKNHPTESAEETFNLRCCRSVIHFFKFLRHVLNSIYLV